MERPATRSAMVGTTCIDEAPVPMIATRLPSSETSSGQQAVWNSGPLKSSAPLMGGSAGRSK